MSLKRVKEIMGEACAGFLATTDGRRPAVRPMSACAWFGQELYIATGADSAKVADVRACPAVEICFMAENFDHVRIRGRAKVSSDLRDKRRIFGAYRWMKDYFGSPDASDWVVLRVRPSSIRLMVMAKMRYQELKRRRPANRR